MAAMKNSGEPLALPSTGDLEIANTDSNLLDAMKNLINTEVEQLETAVNAHLASKIDILLSNFRSAKISALQKATAQIRDEINGLTSK